MDNFDIQDKFWLTGRECQAAERAVQAEAERAFLDACQADLAHNINLDLKGLLMEE